ncbi:MAG: type III-B CRISPR module RAMP protein Cmr4 [bacterium]
MGKSYEQFRVIGLGIDPIHVGTGGQRLGRVDLSIVRDPVTRVPKIPGSSLAGVCRTYAAMALNRYPMCAGQGQPEQTGHGGHCGGRDCPICTVFGFARGTGGGFAGLAAFSDAHVLLFPVATRKGPLWVTSPSVLRLIGCQINDSLESALYQKEGGQPLNLGWLLLEVKQHNGWQEKVKQLFCDKDLREYVGQNLGLLRDDLFTHVVNSNLEVRTSVSINPETGAAEEGALFSYEALPRATVLMWEVVCKNPQHFRIGGQEVCAQVNSKPMSAPAEVFEVVKKAHDYLEHLGIGGMGTRGMGRLWVIHSSSASSSQASTAASVEASQPAPGDSTGSHGGT